MYHCLNQSGSRCDFCPGAAEKSAPSQRESWHNRQLGPSVEPPKTQWQNETHRTAEKQSKGLNAQESISLQHSPHLVPQRLLLRIFWHLVIWQRTGNRRDMNSFNPNILPWSGLGCTSVGVRSCVQSCKTWREVPFGTPPDAATIAVSPRPENRLCLGCIAHDDSSDRWLQRGP